jgi:hypothetical protein
MVTMSQKSSDPQAVKSVSQALMPDTPTLKTSYFNSSRIRYRAYLAPNDHKCLMCSLLVAVAARAVVKKRNWRRRIYNPCSVA